MKPVLSFWGQQMPTFSLFAILAITAVIIVFLQQNFMKRELRKAMLKPILYAIPATLFVGKLFHVVGTFIQNPGIPFAELMKHFGQGGFVFYGGLIGFILAIIIYAKVSHADTTGLFNFWCAYIPLLQGIGRFGCFYNGCCYGIETTSVLGVNYPLNGELVHVFPVQIVEGVFCLILSFVMFKWVKQERRGLVYFIAYPMGRFVLEYFRGDINRGHLWFFSTSQWVSLVILPLCL